MEIGRDGGGINRNRKLQLPNNKQISNSNSSNMTLSVCNLTIVICLEFGACVLEFFLSFDCL